MGKMMTFLFLLLVVGAAGWVIFGGVEAGKKNSPPNAIEAYSTALPGMTQKARDAGARLESRENVLDQQLGEGE
ncbi:MAG: hypothetical protein OEW11_10685 [Nitrospirota bacterium]|nr:hypothetical protein [Nitrospirota bacterium]